MAFVKAGTTKKFSAVNGITTSGATINSAFVPCRGAKCVVFRVRSATVESISTKALHIIQTPGGTVYTVAGQGYAEKGTLPTSLADGGAMMFCNADGALPIFHDYVRLQITHGTGFTGAVVMDADVIYASEDDLARSGQATADVV